MMTSSIDTAPWQPASGTRQAEVLEAVATRGSIRIADLADELGVTAITVRRDVAALAEAGLVRRVHGGATRLRRTTGSDGSAPLPSSQLRGAAAIGALVPSLDFYWPDVIRGAEEAAKRHGRRLSLRETMYHAVDERPDLNRLIATSTAGLLIAPTVDGAAGAHLEDWLATVSVPVVLMERQFTVQATNQPLESVVTDHAGGASTAVRHLASLGHTRIGLVLNLKSPHMQQIRRGWSDTLAELNFDTAGITDRNLPERSEPGFDGAIDDALDDVLSAKVTALVVHSDPEAVRLVQRAEELGISIPGALSVISYDDQVAALASPALSAIRPPRRAIGETAVDLLLARIENPARPIHRVQVSPKLVVRASTGPVQA